MALFGLQERTVKKPSAARPFSVDVTKSEAPSIQPDPSGSGRTGEAGAETQPKRTTLFPVRERRFVLDPGAPGVEMANPEAAGAPDAEADATDDSSQTGKSGGPGRNRRKSSSGGGGRLRSSGPNKTGGQSNTGKLVTQSSRGQNRKSGSGSGSGKGRKSKSGKKNKLDIKPPKPGTPPVPVMPTAGAARRKRRHVGVVFSFLLLVISPVAVAAWYLYERASDQYASTMGFSVRKEEAANAAEVLGGAIDFGTGNVSDTDVLYEFIQSQGLVESIDTRLDLRRMYSIPDNDPIFTIAPNAPIEKLVSYWKRMVTIYYDSGTGLIETRVLAFTPDDAQAITRAIFDESSAMINRLTTVAREDATRDAREELERAEERLKQARASLTEFRARTQIVDPNIDIQGQMGLLNNLQAQLAEALIELDLLFDNTRAGDPRIRQAEQRIAVIEKRIVEERQKFGIGENGGTRQAYASLVGDYETLVVDREFAEKSYLAALANFDAAQADAQRKTRYLAAYAQPTLAESSEYPQREVILAVFALFSMAVWAVGTLIYYSVRDRR